MSYTDSQVRNDNCTNSRTSCYCKTTLRWGLLNSRPTPHNHYNDNTRDPAPPAIVYQNIQRLHSYPDRTPAPPSRSSSRTAFQIPASRSGSSNRACHAHPSDCNLLCSCSVPVPCSVPAPHIVSFQRSRPLIALPALQPVPITHTHQKLHPAPFLLIQRSRP